ncbi:hypothetical protein [Paenibacillus sp. UMB4589-SE434]|uniref:hypothetical protein n=1 Tax=Paenibacillus sp. UMB4589-SE434 TaxID=3046314 RepID=UPI002550607E|nr:hypothetical protein [Paenibacillus sp. UMB4589-SE434]MDK8182084.1 hypothetical protein [Paenibacillus sp. UMB4589-SE434]
MDKIDPVKVIDSLLTTCEIMQTKTLSARYEIEYREGEYNDIGHLLEFGKLNAVELVQLSKQLKASKIARREAILENELLSILYEYVQKPQNQAFFNGLKQIRIDIEKARRLQAKRQYKIRVRTDLQPILDKAQSIETV